MPHKNVLAVLLVCTLRLLHGPSHAAILSLVYLMLTQIPRCRQYQTMIQTCSVVVVFLLSVILSSTILCLHATPHLTFTASTPTPAEIQPTNHHLSVEHVLLAHADWNIRARVEPERTVQVPRRGDLSTRIFNKKTGPRYYATSCKGAGVQCFSLGDNATREHSITSLAAIHVSAPAPPPDAFAVTKNGETPVQPSQTKQDSSARAYEVSHAPPPDAFAVARNGIESLPHLRMDTLQQYHVGRAIVSQAYKFSRAPGNESWLDLQQFWRDGLQLWMVDFILVNASTPHTVTLQYGDVCNAGVPCTARANATSLYLQLCAWLSGVDGLGMQFVYFDLATLLALLVVVTETFDGSYASLIAAATAPVCILTFDATTLVTATLEYVLAPGQFRRSARLFFAMHMAQCTCMTAFLLHALLKTHNQIVQHLLTPQTTLQYPVFFLLQGRALLTCTLVQALSSTFQMCTFAALHRKPIHIIQ